MPLTTGPILDANRYQYPSNRQGFGSNDQLELTIDDLKGDDMLLINFLVAHGIMETTPEDYATLAEISQKDYQTLIDADIASFEAILNKPQTRFNAGASLRFMGGIFANQNLSTSSNLLILLVLKRLNLAAVPYKILFSEPDTWFIESVEGQKSFYKLPKQDLPTHNLHFILQDDIPPPEPAASTAYHPLSVTRQAIVDIFETAYKAHLLLLSYTLSNNQKEIIIYSYASIGLETIKSLSKELLGKKKYKQSTSKKLANTIDEINRAFTERCKDNNITQTKSKPALFSAAAAEIFNQWLNDNKDATTPQNFTAPFQFPAVVVLACNHILLPLDRPAKLAKKDKEYACYFVQANNQATLELYEPPMEGLDPSKVETGNYQALISVRDINALSFTQSHAPISRQPSERPPVQPQDVAPSSMVATSSHPPLNDLLSPHDLPQATVLVEADTQHFDHDINNAITFEQEAAFFPTDIAAGLQLLKTDILNRHWITNMGGETLIRATTKVPKSIANIYGVINNAEIDQNNHSVTLANWFATRVSVVNLLAQAVNADHFSRDPQTQQWLKKVFLAGQQALIRSKDIINDPQIEDEVIANIFNHIQQTGLTGGQTISIETADGTQSDKKVPRTLATIYSLIQKAQKDNNGHAVITPNWQTTRQQIFITAKTSADNRTFFRTDETQKAIVDMVDSLIPNTQNIKNQLLQIKAETLDILNKPTEKYSVGFFSKTVLNAVGAVTTISWKEKEILDLIQQVDDGLLPAISAGEKISTLIGQSENLAFLKQANDNLTHLLNTEELSHFRLDILRSL